MSCKTEKLEKPCELVLYRHPSVGGLGLYHIQARALANLINNFLETACNPRFKRNYFHEALLKQNVLEEEPTNILDIPPYFKGDFFPAIRRIHQSPLNIANIRIKQIYRFLIEEITMETTTLNSLLHFYHCELNLPFLPTSGTGHGAWQGSTSWGHPDQLFVHDASQDPSYCGEVSKNTSKPITSL